MLAITTSRGMARHNNLAETTIKGETLEELDHSRVILAETRNRGEFEIKIKAGGVLEGEIDSKTTTSGKHNVSNHVMLKMIDVEEEDEVKGAEVEEDEVEEDEVKGDEVKGAEVKGAEVKGEIRGTANCHRLSEGVVDGSPAHLGAVGAEPVEKW